MASGKDRDYFGNPGSEPPQAPLTYWRDPQLESVFDYVNPATHYGFDVEFTPAEERTGRQLFHTGFVDKSVSKEVRGSARDEFLDWMDQWDVPVDEADFWDAWREWYEETT